VVERFDRLRIEDGENLILGGWADDEALGAV
jgi:hypothetical protein